MYYIELFEGYMIYCVRFGNYRYLNNWVCLKIGFRERSFFFIVFDLYYLFFVFIKGVFRREYRL